MCKVSGELQRIFHWQVGSTQLVSHTFISPGKKKNSYIRVFCNFFNTAIPNVAYKAD